MVMYVALKVFIHNFCMLSYLGFSIHYCKHVSLSVLHNYLNIGGGTGPADPATAGPVNNNITRNGNI